MTDVDICNLALSHIRVEEISNLTEGTRNSDECDRLYDPTRQAILEDFMWSFATKRLTLALTAGETVSAWKYVYTYPSDGIIARWIHNPVGTSSTISWDSTTSTWIVTGKIPFEVGVNAALDGKRIMTDEATAELVYTADVKDANLFSPQFVTAFSYALAAELAQPLRANSDLQKLMHDKYIYHLARAQTVNANEDYQVPNNSCDILDAR